MLAVCLAASYVACRHGASSATMKHSSPEILLLISIHELKLHSIFVARSWWWRFIAN
jgi:hypothetical protein